MPNKYESDGLNKFGSNPDVDAAAPEDVWDGGGLYVFPTATRIHDLVSSDAADAAAGTGARTVLVQGLDANYLEIEETITLNGITNVPTTKSYLRINRMIVKSAGSGGVNAGTITATAQVDSTVSSQITIGKNQTLQAIYTIPADADLSLNNYFVAIGKTTATSLDGSLLVRPFGEVFQIKHTIPAVSTGDSHGIHEFKPPLMIAAKSDIKIQVATMANDTLAFGGFDGNFSRPLST